MTKVVELALKPWHFGALSGIILCHTELEDKAMAERWAAHAMPKRGTAEREDWVRRQLKVIDSKPGRGERCRRT